MSQPKTESTYSQVSEKLNLGTKSVVDEFTDNAVNKFNSQPIENFKPLEYQTLSEEIFAELDNQAEALKETWLQESQDQFEEELGAIDREDTLTTQMRSKGQSLLNSVLKRQVFIDSPPLPPEAVLPLGEWAEQAIEQQSGYKNHHEQVEIEEALAAAGQNWGDGDALFEQQRINKALEEQYYATDEDTLPLEAPKPVPNSYTT